MASLTRYLIDYDIDLLLIIAGQWDLEFNTNDRLIITEALAAAMSADASVSATWERLSPEARAALHELRANEGHQPYVHFTRRYGEIRAMGPARREREKPWLEPINTTEALYYRGLIFRGFEQTPSGMQEFIQVPDELFRALPEPAPGTITRAPGFASVPRRQIEDGYDTAVDDLTTILAYLMIRDSDASNWFTEESVCELDRHLRHPQIPYYRVMLLTLAVELNLIDITTKPTSVNKEKSRVWLKAPREHQQRSLIEAWMNSTNFNELAFTPGLEADEWPNDPLLARQAAIADLIDVPPDLWWNVESFIEHIKQTNPDFQRPGGDYTSWYIEDSYSGKILSGLEYWDFIEGALLNLLFKGPLRWLGIIRRGSFAFMLTKVGAALVGHTDWPSEPDPPALIAIDKQGTIQVPVTFDRYERLQLARFTSWIGTPPPSDYVPATEAPDRGFYLYRLTPQAIRRVQADGFQIDQIIGFLGRNSGGKIPKNVHTMLKRWDEDPDEVVVEDVVIVYTKNLGVYESLKKEKRIKDLLERPTDVNSYAVKRDNLLTLLSSLREVGYFPLFKGHKKDDLP